MSGFRIALTFLTRVPAGSTVAQTDMAASVPWFPVVGALVGVAVAGVYAVAALVLAPVIAACLALAAGIVVTGGFHEDGLGDTADAFGGGWDRDDRLRIMKDSRQGTFGVLALCLSVVIRVAALAALSPLAAVAVVPTAHALSRAGALWLTVALPPASVDGLGVSYRAGGSRARVAIASGVGLLIALAFAGLWSVAFALAAAVSVLGVGVLAADKIEGFTGDVLGAAQQAAEIGILVVAAALAPEMADAGLVLRSFVEG